MTRNNICIIYKFYILYVKTSSNKTKDYMKEQYCTFRNGLQALV